MRLGNVTSGHVARNARNGSHYRFCRMENGKARIVPLEVFPGGLLLAKPTPTTIDANIEVVVLGPWADGMIVDAKPSSNRAKLEAELIELERLLPVLKADYDALPRGGKGETSRGSWANKVINTRKRIAMLKVGLGFVADADAPVTVAMVVESQFSRNQIVQVPSGRLGVVLALNAMGDQTYATVRTAFEGKTVQAAVPCEVLRDGQQSRVCTI